MRIMPLMVFGCCVLLCCAGLRAASAEDAKWIWHSAEPGEPAPKTCFLRRTFETPHLNWKAVLTVAGGEPALIFLNGEQVATTENWNKPVRLEVSVKLKQGWNVLAIQAGQRSGPAGVFVMLEMTGAGGEGVLVSDGSWRATAREFRGWTDFGFDDTNWSNAQVVGNAGDTRWGDILRRPTATPADAIQAVDGFAVELLRSAGPDEGSWICMTADARGRLIISPQGDAQPLLRVTLAEDGAIAGVRPIATSVRHAMGLLSAHGSLYVNGHGPRGTGLYRLIDRNGNDDFEPDEVQLLKNFKGEGEHGYHALALGPDDMIYVMNGNSTAVLEGLLERSAYRNYSGDRLRFNAEERESQLLGAPAGQILRTDANGTSWELLAGGLRNAYDFDFNTDGEMFTFDSDMEWDWGSPWYVPTRILHCVPGGEYGWRSGTEWWPAEYEDRLPAAVEVGIGSPTGIKFGTKSRFPEKYRRSLFVLDWSYGRILTVDLRSNGASYRGEVNPFLQGRPLNVTDLEFGSDGAMYFITGGRGTQSGLYRVRYSGTAGTTNDEQPTRNAESSDEEQRALRRSLDQFAAEQNQSAVAFAWPHLNSEDRWIRYAARRAIERQPLEQWNSRALDESDSRTGLVALLALARQSMPGLQSDLFRALEKFPLSSLDRQRQLLKLRVIELALVRHGNPSPDVIERLMDELGRHYPAFDWPIDRELSRFLAYLRAPEYIEKTLQLMDRSPMQEQQIHYVSMLRHVRNGWTLEQRKKYFNWWSGDRRHLGHSPDLLRWFNQVGRDYTDGAHLHLILDRFREEAVRKLNDEERSHIEALIQPRKPPEPSLPVNRPVVKEWTMADLEPDVDRVGRDRNFERGRQAYVDAQCLACHKMGDSGGAIGPELTGAAAKYSARDLLESIIEPSKVISEQYQNTTVILKNGEEVTGQVTAEDELNIELMVDPLNLMRRSIRKSDVQERFVSKLSPMPEGLANVLTRDELLDLLAYIQSGGKPEKR